MKRAQLLLALLSAVIATGAHPHDYWLEPKPWSIASGTAYSVHLLVGDRLSPELERPLQYEMTTRYERHTDAGILDLMLAMPDSALPVFADGDASLGSSLLVMDRKFYSIETTVRGFLEFLEHEGQSELGAQYKGVDLETPLTRRYARAIKTLVRTGTASSSDVHNKIVGQSIEIRLLQNPYTLKPGTPITVHVQFEANDLPNQLVTALVKGSDGAVTEQKGRTDETGRSEFVLDRPGVWLFRVTYLQQCRDCETEWDTYYATFSFILP